MRTVLLLAYDYPPAASVGASIRAVKFARYLPEFGWRPVVLALDPGGRDLPDDGVERVPTWLPPHRPFNLRPWGWIPAAARRASALAGTRSIDLVFATCPPFPPALAAVAAARRLRCPLVTDFRDAWTRSPYPEPSRAMHRLAPPLFAALERRVLRRSAALVLNTPSALAAYRRAYPDLAPRMHHLPNGYDEADFAGLAAPAAAPGAHMQIVHAGAFASSRRDPAPFLRALARFNAGGVRARLTVLGDGAVPPDMADQVTCTGPLDHGAALRAMAAADVLLVYQQPSGSQVTAVAGKTFEYLRTGRAILAVAPAGDNIDLVRRHATRHACVTNYGEDAMVAALESLHAGWRSGAPPPRRTAAEFEACYERRRITQRLAGLFDAVAGQRSLRRDQV
ncbi:MAG: glycosyltransferase [Hyphomicrobiales bacterium]|nr:glycosyltransferase [Hyphomicrobiales bacterium]